MALQPNRDVFITCAVTGAGDTTGRSDKVPVTPRQIAEACIDAAAAGAAVVHIHVRDPESGRPARDPALYAEAVGYIRESGTDMAGASERLAHVAQILPEICTLDCGTMNFGEGDYIMTNTPAMLKAMARQVQALGVRPEIEAFDTGHVLLAKWLKDQGLIDDPVMIQLCMGIPWGAPDDIATLLAMKANMPEDWVFSAFSIGRNQLPYVAMAVLAGGNIRVGLEDNIWLDKGVLATNGQLVERAATIADAMGSRVMGPQEVRDRLKLQKRW